MSDSRLLMLGSASARPTAALSFADHFLRRALGRPHRMPVGDVEPRRARLVGRRHVGQRLPARPSTSPHRPSPCRRAPGRARWRPGRTSDRVARPPCPGSRARRRDRARSETSSRSPSGNRSRQPARRRRSNRARRRLVGIGLEPGDQVLDVFRRKILPRDDELRRDGEEPDRLHLPHVVGQRIGHRVDDVRAPLPDHRRYSRRDRRARRGRRRDCRRPRPCSRSPPAGPAPRASARR